MSGSNLGHSPDSQSGCDDALLWRLKRGGEWHTGWTLSLTLNLFMAHCRPQPVDCQPTTLVCLDPYWDLFAFFVRLPASGPSLFVDTCRFSFVCLYLVYLTWPLWNPSPFTPLVFNILFHRGLESFQFNYPLKRAFVHRSLKRRTFKSAGNSTLGFGLLSIHWETHKQWQLDDD